MTIKLEPFTTGEPLPPYGGPPTINGPFSHGLAEMWLEAPTHEELEIKFKAYLAGTGPAHSRLTDEERVRWEKLKASKSDDWPQEGPMTEKIPAPEEMTADGEDRVRAHLATINGPVEEWKLFPWGQDPDYPDWPFSTRFSNGKRHHTVSMQEISLNVDHPGFPEKLVEKWISRAKPEEETG